MAIEDDGEMSIDPAQPGADMSQPQELVSKVASVVPPEPAIKAPAPGTPEHLVSAVSSVLQPLTKTSTTVTSGLPSGAVEGIIKQRGQRDATAAEQMRADAASADINAGLANDQLQQGAEQRQAEAARQAKQAAQDRKDAEAEVQRLLAAPEAKVDPDRFVASLPTGSKIATVVLAMMSGFASAFQGQAGANPFVAQLDKRIEDDLRAQQEQIASGRLRAGNLIAQARQKGADAKQAEATARAQLWQVAGDLAAIKAQGMQLDGAQARAANAQIQQMYQRSADAADQLRLQTLGRVQSTRMVEDQGQLKIAEARAKAAEEAGKRSEDQGKVVGAIEGLRQLGKAAGLARDDSGKLVPPAGKADEHLPPESSWTWDPRWWKWGEGKAVRRARARASAMLAATGQIKQGEADDLMTAETYGELADKLNGLEATLIPRESPQDRAAPRGAAQFGGRPIP